MGNVGHCYLVPKSGRADVNANGQGWLNLDVDGPRLHNWLVASAYGTLIQSEISRCHLPLPIRIQIVMYFSLTLVKLFHNWRDTGSSDSHLVCQLTVPISSQGGTWLKSARFNKVYFSEPNKGLKSWTRHEHGVNRILNSA